MMNPFKIFGLLIATLTLTTANVSGQTIESLRKEIERAEQQIENTNKLIKSAQSKQKSSEKELKLVRSKITQRKSIIANLDKQSDLIVTDMNGKSSSVSQLQRDVEKLKKEYAEMIYNGYKSYKLNNYVAFLFSSKDFNDLYRRIYYLKQYTKMREKKAEKLQSVSQQLTADIVVLKSEKQRLDSVARIRTKELKTLGSDEQQYKNIVSDLKRTQGKLSKELKAKRSVVQNLQKKIEQIIAEEARKSKAKKRTTAQTEQYVALSSKFDQNMGRLPHPVSGGAIVDRYGRHEHPTQKSIMIDNKGINIAAGAGAEVRSVFEGEVSRIFFFKGLNNTVMVRHGNYVTVYSNLQDVSVKTGDKVATSQRIGTLSNGQDSELHFEIWKETTNLDPTRWLRR